MKIQKRCINRSIGLSDNEIRNFGFGGCRAPERPIKICLPTWWWLQNFWSNHGLDVTIIKLLWIDLGNGDSV